MTQAMKMIREELGDDAVIVSSQNGRDANQVLVTAAVDASDEITGFSNAPTGAGGSGDLGSLALALNGHGVPAGIIDALMDAAWDSGTTKPELALAAALDRYYRFEPLGHRQAPRPVMLVGPHGSGKSTTAAKLAARAALAGNATELITTDTVRAGGVDQLAGFSDILGIPLHVAEGPGSLTAAVGGCAPGSAIVVDSAGINPFDGAAIAALSSLAAAAGAEPVLVLAAGGDPTEAAEVARAFADIGVTRLIATRLDSTRRYGGILAAAAPPMNFSEISVQPQVANGLSPVNPVSLARLILSGPAPTRPQDPHSEEPT